MEKGLIDAITYVADVLGAEFIGDKKDELVDALKDKRLSEAFIKAVTAAGQRRGLELEMKRDGLSEEMLRPGQNSEDMARRVEGILREYVLEGQDPQADYTLLREVCETYLKGVEKEITDADVIKEVHRVREILNGFFGEWQKQLALLPYIAQNVQEIRTIVEQAQAAGGVQRAESTKEYERLYKKVLFWDETITLEQMYIEPEVMGEPMKVTEKIETFLRQEDCNLLIIQGAPGIGKSSLFGMLANKYTGTQYFFLRLSNVDFVEHNSFRAGINSLIATDEQWKHYMREDNVLFLDGYDEVAGRISCEKLCEFVQLMKSKGVKIIITTRPNYLRQLKGLSNEKIDLKPYDYRQIDTWIRTYMHYRGCANEEIEARLQELDEKRGLCEKAVQKNQNILDILGIPIFLYIVYNTGIRLCDVGSKTDLYEMVFKQLLKDKIIKMPEEAEQMAQYLGYYMQAKQITRFGTKEYRGYNMLTNAEGITQEESGRDNLDALLGNSFIRRISEGSEDREFYHKSIQDYFSAKYIYEKLEEVVFTEDAVSYASLLDKHDLQEEMPHLKYFIEKRSSKEKGKLGKKLQLLFEMIIEQGMRPEWESWYADKPEEGLVVIAKAVQRNRRVFDNHMLIMHDIFQMPIVDDNVVMYSEAYPIALRMAGKCVQKEEWTSDYEYFWRAFRYSIMNENIFPKYIKIHNMPKAIRYNVWLRNIRMNFVKFKFQKKWQASFGAEGCVWIGVSFSYGVFDHVRIIQTRIQDLSMEGNEWLDLILSEVNVTQGTLQCKMKDARMENVIFDDCIIRGCELHACYFQNVTYRKCRFEDATFKKTHFVLGLFFENCEFYNTQFNDCDMSEMRFINCIGAPTGE